MERRLNCFNSVNNLRALVKIIGFVSVFVISLITVAFPEDIHATSGRIDHTTCASFGGTYTVSNAEGICSIPSLNVEANETVTTSYPPIRVVIGSITINDGGRFGNDGALSVGTMTINHGGFAKLIGNSRSHEFLNVDTIRVNTGGTLEGGYLKMKTLVVSGGSVDAGTLDVNTLSVSNGVMSGYFIVSEGVSTITETKGFVSTNSGVSKGVSLSVNSGATVNISDSTLKLECGVLGACQIAGVVNLNSGTALYDVGSIVVSGGTLNVNAGSRISINPDGLVITNDYLSSLTIEKGALQVEGTIDVFPNGSILAASSESVVKIGDRGQLNLRQGFDQTYVVSSDHKEWADFKGPVVMVAGAALDVNSNGITNIDSGGNLSVYSDGKSPGTLNVNNGARVNVKPGGYIHIFDTVRPFTGVLNIDPDGSVYVFCKGLINIEGTLAGEITYQDCEIDGQTNSDIFTVSATDLNNSYLITGKSASSKATQVSIDPGKSITVMFDSTGYVELTLPSSLISGIYSVNAGGAPLNYETVSQSAESTTISFTISEGQTSVDILGTQVVPEFSTVTVVLLIASILIVIGTAHLRGKSLRFKY